MSLSEENNMLHILHRNNVSRKHIVRIMKDLKQSEIFKDNYVEENDDDWDIIEEQVYWLFNSEVSNAKRISELKNLKKKQEEFEKIKISQFCIDQEKRIQAKRQELIEKGIIKPDVFVGNKSKQNTRYGRTPLHEAISMKDIRLVEKYIKKGKDLDKKDNNGHTAIEMAYYYNYKEALFLFKKYGKRQKTG